LKVFFDGQIFVGWPVGGVARYYTNLAIQLEAMQGISARIVAPLHRNVYLGELRGAAGFSVRIPAHWRMGRICWKALRLASPLISALGKPDIAHETYFAPRPYLTHARRRVTTVYDMIHELYFSGSDTSKDKKKTLERCDHVLCISRNTQNDLCEMYGIPVERTSVTYLSFQDFGACAGASLPQKLMGRPYFLYVGNRGGYKNFALLLQAFAADARLRGGFRILAIGGGALTGEERALCADLGLGPEDVVQSEGDDGMLGAAYANAAAFVYPSLYEGFGIPPLEAMSVGCPVVSSNSSSIPEVVGDAALLFAPQDQEALRDALVRVVESEDLRLDLAARGMQRCRRFTWQGCAEDTLAAYRKIL
jgi:glycosyltransferase involved in cell wall biosynthesis